MEKDIMLYYIELVEFLGVTLGPSYEIVLYDLRREDQSIIAIANGHISNRSVGAPLTESILRSIAQKTYVEVDYKANFNSVLRDEKVLRSSTLYIKDLNKELVGLLCINFDDSGFKDISNTLLALIHPNDLIQKNNFEKIEDIKFSDESDNIGSTMEEVADTAIDRVLKNSPIPIDRLNKTEKMDIVKILDNKGIFMLKGAIPYVAKLLHSSEATIYRYLSDINSSK